MQPTQSTVVPAKQVYNIGGTKVRATDQASAQNLATEVQSAPTAPVTTPVTTSINAGDVGKQTPIIPPPVNDTTHQTNLGITSGNVATTATNDVKAKDTKPVTDISGVTNAKTAGDYLKSLIGIEATKGDFTTQAQTDAKQTEAITALNDVNKEINNTTQNFDTQIKALGKSGAMSPAQYQAAVSSLTNQKNEAIANLGIKKANAQGDVTLAQSIVESKVKAKFEPVENNIKNIENLYQLYQNDMSESEKLRAQSKIDEKKAKSAETSKVYSEVLQNASLNNAPSSVLSSIDAAVKAENDKMLADPSYTPNVAAIYSAAGRYGADAYKQAQIDNLNSEIRDRNAKGDTVGDPAQVIAYAQQYASTGQIPTGLPKGTFGAVSQYAKELPRPDGTLVDRNTGVKSSKVSPTQEDSIAALVDIPKKLDRLKTLYNSGSISIPYSSNRAEFNALQGEVVDLLARARSGAAINDTELKTYEDKIPSINFSVRKMGNIQLDTLNNSLKGKLDSILTTNGLSMYGYSKITTPAGEFKVGDTVDIGGTKYRVLPDGNLSTLTQ